MKNMAMISAFALMLPVSGAVNAALNNNSTLAFDDGARECAVGGTYPYCDYDLHTVTGSWFAMDLNGDGTFDETDKLAIAMDEGIRIGQAQPTTGESHAGSATGMEDTSIDHAWTFLGNAGMHNTVSPVSIVSDNYAGHVELDFSGWRVDWNGIEDINMGGDPVNFAADTGLATVTCGYDCSAGDSFMLEYTAHVPLGDPSGFGGVYYGLHLEGTVVPVPAAVWLFGSGMLTLAGVARRKKRSS